MPLPISITVPSDIACFSCVAITTPFCDFADCFLTLTTTLFLVGTIGTDEASPLILITGVAALLRFDDCLSIDAILPPRGGTWYGTETNPEDHQIIRLAQLLYFYCSSLLELANMQ